MPRCMFWCTRQASWKSYSFVIYPMENRLGQKVGKKAWYVQKLSPCLTYGNIPLMHEKRSFQLSILTVTVEVSLYFHSFFCQIHSYPNFPENLLNDDLVLHDAHLDNAKRQRKHDNLVINMYFARCHLILNYWNFIWHTTQKTRL